MNDLSLYCPCPAWAAASPDPLVLPGRGNTPLHRAALAGAAREVENLLAVGADARATNDAGATPLHYGVGSLRFVELLLRAGADPSARSRAGSTPLHCAAARPNCLAQVKLLVEAGARIDELRRPDGGWSALPTLESDAWTTGHLLVALHEAGGVPPTDPFYERGVEFLLRTQFPDGSW